RISRPSLKSSSVSAVISLLICSFPVLRPVREKSMSEFPAYKVFALRYATMASRIRRDNFIFTDVHDALMPIDYFVWAIQDTERTIVVDTGFNKTDGERRGRTFRSTMFFGRSGPSVDVFQNHYYQAFPRCPCVLPCADVCLNP